MFDIATIKSAASSRWPDILSRAGGFDHSILDGRNHPCPKCGGKDRFRMIDREAGAVICNQCFSKGNGDGIAAFIWLTGQPFKDAIRSLAGEVGLTADSGDLDVLAEMAWRKSVGVEALKDFGGNVENRNGHPVCRVPMYDADMQKVGDFDMSPETPEMQKGKMTTGSHHGLFVAKQPQPGDSVVIVEGVKDAAALHGLKVASVGLPTCQMDASFARMFRGCDVTIVPDRDRAGTDGAKKTAGVLYGVARIVRIAELPIEWKETGGADVRDVLRTRNGTKKVLDAISNAPEWNGTKLVRPIKFVTILDAMDAYLESEGADAKLLTLGLPGIDRAIGGGVLPGEVIIVAGRPSHGKSVVAMQALDSLSAQVPVLMLSEEMSVRSLAKRMLCNTTSLDPAEWKTRKRDVSKQAVSHFKGKKHFLISESCGTVERAAQAIEKAVREYNIGAVAVDYLQLLRGQGTGRYEQVSDVSTRIKQVAVQHDLVMLAVCQLNRQIEQRQGLKGEQATRGARMSDLRDSGQLEQDADVILFVEWLHRTSSSQYTPTQYRIIVAKNRNRPIVNSSVDCVFKAERQRLYPLEQRESYQDTGKRSSNYEPDFDNPVEGF